MILVLVGVVLSPYPPPLLPVTPLELLLGDEPIEEDLSIASLPEFNSKNLSKGKRKKLPVSLAAMFQQLNRSCRIHAQAIVKRRPEGSQKAEAAVGDVQQNNIC